MCGTYRAYLISLVNSTHLYNSTFIWYVPQERRTTAMNNVNVIAYEMIRTLNNTEKTGRDSFNLSSMLIPLPLTGTFQRKTAMTNGGYLFASHLTGNIEIKTSSLFGGFDANVLANKSSISHILFSCMYLRPSRNRRLFSLNASH